MAEHVTREVQMGIGDAILRLLRIEAAYANGLFTVPEHLKSEREMIVEQLNQYTLDMGFDCNDDSVPDTVEIFKQTAETSCCRILPRDTSRRGVTAVVPETPGVSPTPITNVVEVSTLGVPSTVAVEVSLVEPAVPTPATTLAPAPRRDSSRRKT